MVVHAGAAAFGSQQAHWESVNAFVTTLLNILGVEHKHTVGAWPMIGSPIWCELADHDPLKMAAIYDAAQHWALHVELSQRAFAQMSRDVSSSADWSAFGRRIMRDRGTSYIPRKAAS